MKTFAGAHFRAAAGAADARARIPGRMPELEKAATVGYFQPRRRGGTEQQAPLSKRKRRGRMRCSEERDHIRPPRLVPLAECTKAAAASKTYSYY